MGRFEDFSSGRGWDLFFSERSVKSYRAFEKSLWRDIDSIIALSFESSNIYNNNFWLRIILYILKPLLHGDLCRHFSVIFWRSFSSRGEEMREIEWEAWSLQHSHFYFSNIFCSSPLKMSKQCFPHCYLTQCRVESSSHSSQSWDLLSFAIRELAFHNCAEHLQSVEQLTCFSTNCWTLSQKGKALTWLQRLRVSAAVKYTTRKLEPSEKDCEQQLWEPEQSKVSQ